MRGECRHFASAFARYVYKILKFFAKCRSLEGTASITVGNTSKELDGQNTRKFINPES